MNPTLTRVDELQGHDIETLTEETWPKDSPKLADLVENLAMRSVGRIGVGLNALFGSRTEGKLGIVTYHRVAPNISKVSKPTHNVPPLRFRRQIIGLLSRGYSVWPLRRVLHYRETGKPIPPRTIVITFDDGFETVYTNAWPILRELEVPATVFVSTAYLDSMAPFPFDAWGNAWQRQVPAECYRPLTTAQCREMAADGLVELGAHTHTHRDFRDRHDEFREDLQLSVDIVRERFGEPDPTFAFPFGAPHRGYASEALVEAARQTGVVCALTTECLPVDLRSDPFQWGRFNAFPWDTGATLSAKLDGWYGWAGQLKRRILRAAQ